MLCTRSPPGGAMHNQHESETENEWVRKNERVLLWGNILIWGICYFSSAVLVPCATQLIITHFSSIQLYQLISVTYSTQNLILISYFLTPFTCSSYNLLMHVYISFIVPILFYWCISVSSLSYLEIDYFHLIHLKSPPTSLAVLCFLSIVWTWIKRTTSNKLTHGQKRNQWRVKSQLWLLEV